MVHSVFYKIIPLAIMGILIMSYASKAPPEGHTGSPTDGKSCAISGCHGTSSIAGSNMISHDIPSTGYEPGKEYNVSVVVSKSSSSVFGFQFSAQASDGSKVGTLTSGGF